MQGIATLQDITALEEKGIPKDLPPSTYDMIRSGAAIDPAAPALSFFLTADAHRRPETWSYSELLADITRTANFFSSLGVQRDDVIAFVLPNLPETHFVIWGGEAVATVFAINPLLEPSAISDLLKAAGATVLVTLAPFPGTDLWDKVGGLLPSIPTLKHLVLVNLLDRVRGWKHPLAWMAQKKHQAKAKRMNPQSVTPKTIRIHDFGSSIKAKPSDRLSCESPAAKDFSSYFCTGGTTGLPKIAVRKHSNEVANAWSAGQFLGDSVGPGKTIFCGLPLFHVNGVLVTGLLPFSKGAHVVLGTPQGYRGPGVIPRFWEIVERHQINFFSGVPTLYAALLQVPIAKRAVGSLEYGLCGAAPMPIEVFRSFQELTGVKILEGYGLTEGTCVSSVNPPLGDRRLGSIGLRVPGQAMKAVVISDQGEYVRDCQTNEVGALVIAGPNIFSGYKIESQNKGLWLDCRDQQQWMNTGDLARQDVDGYFWLTGRKKELIIRGGHNIDPASIEEPLHRHPAVAIAAAVGRPDAHAGELPVAYVQLKPGVSVKDGELEEFLKREITERAALPRHVRIIKAMPLTAVGKIFKPALKLAETRNAIESALSEAGLSFKEVLVNDDKSKGMAVTVTLGDGKDSEAARKVLGQFPFNFSLDHS